VQDKNPSGLSAHVNDKNNHGDCSVQKRIPFTKEMVEKIIERYPTPFHLYDERGIRENARSFIGEFSGFNGFKNYFAVKALPNPFIMKILKEEGMGADASSLPELLLAERVGLSGEQIMFTSNDTPAAEFRKAKDLGAIINLDDITHLDFLEKSAGLPELLCFRYNPGSSKKGNMIIGNPEEAKYGLTADQLIEGFGTAKAKGVKRFGLHTMVASNELDPEYFVETAKILFKTAIDIQHHHGIKLEFVNLGGGIGIPYRPEQNGVDLSVVASGIRKLYDSMIVPEGLEPLKIFMECGRMVTGPFGYLVTTALHHKNTYRHYVGLDACMANLMRPALYGSYHHISVMGKERAPLDHVYDVTGSLCENNDKFAIQRPLPGIDRGDIVVIHDTGAHGHAMGFNYNGKLRSAELLLREDGSVECIRRAETVEDHFATLDFSNL
jgi:diaminopimelate decarboxylase